MRSAIITISILVMTLSSVAQEWSEKAHYDAYVKGDWEEVLRIGKEANKVGADYYYIRVRNGYANFMLGKYFKAEKEFEKALKFNGSDLFASRYGYWSSVYAGNSGTALLKTRAFASSGLDTMQIIKPKWINRVSVVGGYRMSTSQNFEIDLPGGLIAEVEPPASMPFFSMFLNHQLGRRITLNHGVNYVEQSRPAQLSPDGTEFSNVWQVGYMASLSIQVASHTTITPSFIMQYWEAGENKVYDLSATVSVQQQFGNVNATLIGGYFQDTDTNKYMVGGSLTWYPLQNSKLFSITSGGYNIGGDSPHPFFRQTVGGNLAKRLWLRSSFTWNNQVIVFEDIGVDFANNSSDRLKWMWSVSPTYYPIDKLGVSLIYSVESRQFYLPGVENPLPIGEDIVGEYSGRYNFHSFYLGLNYNF